MVEDQIVFGVSKDIFTKKGFCMLTFEAIRELERNEKNSRKLQRIPPDFIQKLGEYISKKESISEKTTSDIMELENVKSTIKRFYELREKKITESALDAARTGMVPENLNAHEEHAFWLLVGALKDQRERFFSELNKPKASKIEQVVEEVQTAHIPSNEVLMVKEEIQKSEPIIKPVLYKVLRTLPAFVGLDMSIYELKEGDIKEIPKPLNELLLKEGVITEYKESL